MPQLRLLIHRPHTRIAALGIHALQLTQDIQELIEVVLVLLGDGSAALLGDFEEGAGYGANFLRL